MFFADDFFGPFQAFLITLGVPIAAWCGIFIADLFAPAAGLRRRRPLHVAGRYGAVRPGRRRASWSSPRSSAGGWSRASTDEFDWQGYLLDPFGLGGKQGDWAFANIGVLVALAVGFIGYALLGRGRVHAQEAQPVMPEQPAQVG